MFHAISATVNELTDELCREDEVLLVYPNQKTLHSTIMVQT
jgi:hypothetical protein